MALALVTRHGDASHFLPLLPGRLSGGLLTAIGLAMISTLFAYDGWQFVSFVAGEIRDPQRNVPRSIILGVFIVIVVYVSANLAYIYVLGQPRIAASQRVAADAMSAMIGPIGATLISLTILCFDVRRDLGQRAGGSAGVLCDGVATGLLFPQLARIHPRYETPANAIWALAIWAALLTLTGGYEHLITMSRFCQLDLLHHGRAVGHRAATQTSRLGPTVSRHGLSIYGDCLRPGLVGLRRQHARGVGSKFPDGARAAPAWRAVLSAPCGRRLEIQVALKGESCRLVVESFSV